MGTLVPTQLPSSTTQALVDPPEESEALVSGSIGEQHTWIRH